MTSIVLSIQEVAELLGLPDPEGPKAARTVRRMVRQGMPVVRGLAPLRFLRVHVEAWIVSQSKLSPDYHPSSPKVRSSRKVRSSGADIDAEIERLKALTKR